MKELDHTSAKEGILMTETELSKRLRDARDHLLNKNDDQFEADWNALTEAINFFETPVPESSIDREYTNNFLWNAANNVRTLVQHNGGAWREAVIEVLKMVAAQGWRVGFDDSEADIVNHEATRYSGGCVKNPFEN